MYIFATLATLCTAENNFAYSSMYFYPYRHTIVDDLSPCTVNLAPSDRAALRVLLQAAGRRRRGTGRGWRRRGSAPAAAGKRLCSNELLY